MPQANIVQAEFSREDRIGKCVVRFYDEVGALTSYANRLAKLQRRKCELAVRLAEATGWRRWWLEYRFRHTVGLYIINRHSAVGLATEWLEKTIDRGGSVAVERKDFRFRPARQDDLRIALLAARFASDAWLFIFEPNDLLADKNKQVVTVM